MAVLLFGVPLRPVHEDLPERAWADRRIAIRNGCVLLLLQAGEGCTFI